MDEWIMQEAFDEEGFCFFKDKKIKHTVLGALPNEKVRANLLGRARREAIYIVDEVLVPHPFRIAPCCVEVPRCGGCLFQTFDYKAQLALKQKRIEAFFPFHTSKILPIIPSPSQFGYRAKMDFSFSQNKAGEKFLGLIQAKGKGRVMNTSYCHLAPSWMNEALRVMRHSFEHSSLQAYNYRDAGDLRRCILREGRATGDKMVILELAAHSASAFKQTDIASFFEPLQACLGSDVSLFLSVIQTIKGQATQQYEMHLGGKNAIEERLDIGGRSLIFKISPSAFFQPNPEAAERLFGAALKMIEPYKIKTALDLYCGTGSVSLALSTALGSCVGVEINPYAVFDAEANAEANQIAHVSFVCQDAGAFIAQKIQEKGSFDLVMVDPPRAGLGPKAIEALLKLSPQFILYISCNPKTQAIDAEKLFESSYKVIQIQPVDQFPHTNHVENILFLQKLVQ